MSHTEFDEIRFLSQGRVWFTGDDVVYGLTKTVRPTRRPPKTSVPETGHSIEVLERLFGTIHPVAVDVLSEHSDDTKAFQYLLSELDLRSLFENVALPITTTKTSFLNRIEQAFQEEDWVTLTRFERARARARYEELKYFYSMHPVLLALLYEPHFEEAIRFGFATLDTRLLRQAMAMALRRVHRAIVYLNQESIQQEPLRHTSNMFGTCTDLMVPIIGAKALTVSTERLVPFDTSFVLREVNREISTVKRLFRWLWTETQQTQVPTSYTASYWVSHFCTTFEFTNSSAFLDPALVLKELLRQALVQHGRVEAFVNLVDMLHMKRSATSLPPVQVLTLERLIQQRVLEFARLLTDVIDPMGPDLPVSTTIPVRWRTKFTPHVPSSPIYAMAETQGCKEVACLAQRSVAVEEDTVQGALPQGPEWWSPFEVNFSRAIHEKTHKIGHVGLKRLMDFPQTELLKDSLFASLSFRPTMVLVNLSRFPEALEETFVSYQRECLQRVGKLLMSEEQRASERPMASSINHFLPVFERVWWDSSNLTAVSESVQTIISKVTGYGKRMTDHLANLAYRREAYSEALRDIEMARKTHKSALTLDALHETIQERLRLRFKNNKAISLTPAMEFMLFKHLEDLADDLLRTTIVGFGKPADKQSLPRWDKVTLVQQGAVTRHVTFLMDRRQRFTYFFRGNETRYEPEVRLATSLTT